MSNKVIIASIVWGTSLLGAGWLGRTYFADSTPPAADGGRASLDANLAARVAPAREDAAPVAPPTAEPTKAEREASQLKDFFTDTTKTPAERLLALLNLEDPTERMMAFAHLLPTLQSNEDFQSAVKTMMENVDPRGRGRELAILMTEWAKHDPEAALASLGKTPDGIGRYAASSALQTWVKNDPAAAKAWAIEHGKDLNKDEGNWYMVGVISGLAKQDLNTAAAWAQEQPRSRARGDMLDKVIDAFTKQRGLDGLQEWASGLEAGPFRDGAIRRAADAMSEKDPTKTAAWIAALPTGDARVGAMSELMDNWSGKDPNAAGTWLKNYPPSPETDEPRETFARNIRERDPESAVAWASTISDQKRRDRAMLDLVKDWNKRDQKSAQAYMVGHHWPEQTIKRVLN